MMRGMCGTTLWHWLAGVGHRATKFNPTFSSMALNAVWSSQYFLAFNIFCLH